MAQVKIVMDLTEKPLSELQGKTIRSGHVAVLGGMPQGMESGAASVAVVIPLEDGTVVFAETSLALLQAATKALTAKYGGE